MKQRNNLGGKYVKSCNISYPYFAFNLDDDKLPEASVFVVPKSSIVARLTQATEILHQKAMNGERVPSCVNFISGPSSTADIELIKVVGLHGPVFATYIIIDDM